MGDDYLTTTQALKVTSYVQAKFHLDRNEILVYPVNWFKTIYVRKDDVDSIELAIVPKFGSASMFEGDFKALENMMKEYAFYVVPGGKLIEKQKHTLVDKAILKLQTIFKRGD